MPEINPQIEPSWKELLKDEFNSSYFISLKEFLVEEKKSMLSILREVRSSMLLIIHLSIKSE